MIEPSKDQMQELYGISNNIFSMLTHEISHPIFNIHYFIDKIKNEIFQKKTENPEIDFSQVEYLLDKLFRNQKAIADVRNTMSSFSVFQSKDGNPFISVLKDIAETIQGEEGKDIIDLDAETVINLRIIYPYHILKGILAELIFNSSKASQLDKRVIMKWKMRDKKFQCEIHDKGPGFQGVKIGEFVTIDRLRANHSEAIQDSGLYIISDIIRQSNGVLLFSKSRLTNGALVFFEFPVLDFTV